MKLPNITTSDTIRSEKKTICLCKKKKSYNLIGEKPKTIDYAHCLLVYKVFT